MAIVTVASKFEVSRDGSKVDEKKDGVVVSDKAKVSLFIFIIYLFIYHCSGLIFFFFYK